MRNWIGLALLVASSIWAQSESASLTGLVSDSGGAPMPEVAISVTYTDTGATWRVRHRRSRTILYSGLAAGHLHV